MNIVKKHQSASNTPELRDSLEPSLNNEGSDLSSKQISPISGM